MGARDSKQAMIYLVANWKSHKTLKETLAFAEALGTVSPHVTQVLCPPTPFLIPLSSTLTSLHKTVPLGVQDLSPYPPGAYTGAVAAPMVAEFARYAILGHSERRRYFGETSQQVANKVSQALEMGITPIVCVDEPYATEQAATLSEADFARLIVAYEPLEAIGTGTPDSPTHAATVITTLKNQFGQQTPVLYGGSVTAASLPDFLATGVIDGALVGGASLAAQSWNELIEAANQFHTTP